jgi:hypothetical protein
MASSAMEPTKEQCGQQIMQLASGYIPAICLNIVVKLGIADMLKNGALPVAEIASRAGMNASTVYRVLRLLASFGVFVETRPQIFALTPAAEMLRSDTPGSLHALVSWISDPFHFRVFANLPHSVKTGGSAIERTFGKTAFEYLETDPEEREVFQAAMTNFSSANVPPIVEAYDFSNIGTLVDVGGGRGYMLGSILRKYPVMKGILFDMPSCFQGGEETPEIAGLDGRCRIERGDFFAEIPAGGDAYIMKHIIHDWNDEKATVILRNCGKALAGKPQGKVLVVDAVVPPGNEPNLAKVMDIEMMAMCESEERNAEQFGKLFAAAGLRLSRIVPTRSHLSILEGVPA